MPWYGVNRVMKQLMQCHRCYTFPYNVLLIYAVSQCKSNDETIDAMP